MNATRKMKRAIENDKRPPFEMFVASSLHIISLEKICQFKMIRLIVIFLELSHNIIVTC